MNVRENTKRASPVNVDGALNIHYIDIRIVNIIILILTIEHAHRVPMHRFDR